MGSDDGALEGAFVNAVGDIDGISEGEVDG